MKISVLDCTLRDGGYVNSFHFGASTIHRVANKLCEANIDIIECGFLVSGKSDADFSLYGEIGQIPLPEKRKNCMFVAMIEHGGMSEDEVAPCGSESIDGIRLTFHNSEWEDTKKLAANLMEKGYKVFIQPIGTATYTDTELLALISEVNKLSPFAFYIVDTLGAMYRNDLLRMFYLVDHNLNEDIAIGFHSHNNLQLSFANCMTILDLKLTRHIILDSSVFGMGRGAGNLNTELITHYINSHIGMSYDTVPILELIDDVIMKIYRRYPWGYSAPYYLAAIRGMHPNYAQFLLDKQSVPIPKIGNILDKLPAENRHLFNLANIERLYFEEMRNATDDAMALETLRTLVKGRSILVIAPGNSVHSHSSEITNFIRINHPIIITVNFILDYLKSDIVFVGNIKRYAQLKLSSELLLVTSNINANADNVLTVDYESLLSQGANSDSSGMMILRLLVKIGVKVVSLAGYDGFVGDSSYYAESLDNYLTPENIQRLNINTAMQMGELRKQLKIEHITPTLYDARKTNGY